MMKIQLVTVCPLRNLCRVIGKELELEVEYIDRPFQSPKDKTSPFLLYGVFLADSPMLEYEGLVLRKTSDIMRFLCRLKNSDLYLGSIFRMSKIDEWLSFCTDIRSSMQESTGQLIGRKVIDEKKHIEALKKIFSSIHSIEKELKATGCDFLVQTKSIADYYMVATYWLFFRIIFAPIFQKSFPCTTAWVSKVVKMDAFKEAYGVTKFADESLLPPKIQALMIEFVKELETDE